MIPERLDWSQKSEGLRVLKQAFATHPMMPPGTPVETTRAMLELIVDTFSRTEKSYLFGIRNEGTLACVSFCTDARYEPKGIALVRFFYRFFRIMGWRLSKDFLRAFANRPKYEDPYLEFALLGTLPAHHGKGLGRAMLRFLYDFASENEYRGIILEVAKDTPAYHLYLEEGFVVDRETAVCGVPLCHTRRETKTG